MVKEILDYENMTFGMQLPKTYKIFLLGWIFKKNLHATVEVNLLYNSLWNELVICSAFRSIFYIHFTSVEKHVNWSLNLTRNGPHQEINEVEPVNRIGWFVHG